MSELGSAVESLRSEDLADRPDALIEEDFLELQRVSELLELERLRRLAEIDRRRLFERKGHLSAASWLASRCNLGWGSAPAQVRVAGALKDMPATRRALEAGEVSMSAARVLTAARDTGPVAFARSEDELVEAARIHRVGDLQRVTAFWREHVGRERHPDGDDGLRARRRLHASVTFEGMVRLDGDLDPEGGEALLTALGAVMDADTRGQGEGDSRSVAQRRADALHEICRQWLDLHARPSVAGQRPHLVVTIGAEVLAGTASGPAECDHAGPIPAEVARRVGCDASVMRVVLAGASEPLDIGRRTPVVPAALRRAVVLRDRGCRFPGCDRPQTWCDAHHAIHWADGEETSLANLLLLCRRHHRLVHERGGFGLSIEDGAAVFRRPDGTRLEDRAPP
jgi:Domain of unknown function (DUF222)